MNPPDDGLGDLFSGRLHAGWTQRNTRVYAAGCLSVLAVVLMGAAGVWAFTADHGLAWLILAATVALTAALAVIGVARRQHDP